jgi:hypothetical protein
MDYVDDFLASAEGKVPDDGRLVRFDDDPARRYLTIVGQATIFLAVNEEH